MFRIDIFGYYYIVSKTLLKPTFTANELFENNVKQIHISTNE